MIQQYKQNITGYLITINDVYFLFNEKPSLDKQEVHRVLIFYEYFEYSLQELSEHLQNQKLKLGHIQHLELTLHLLQILHNCYNSYLYRLNLTLNTLYWVSKAKRFKLQTFGRIQNLLILDGKDDNAKFKNFSNESKIKTFNRDFERDFGAVLDIILHFRLLSTDVATIKKLRRKRKNLPDGELFYSNYLCLYDETFSSKEDQVFLGLVRLRFFENNTFINQMEEIQSIISTLEKQIKDETTQQENLLEELLIKEQSIEQLVQIQGNEIESEEFTSFDIHIERVKKEEYNQEQSQYYQMLYSSILYSQNFNIICDQFMAVAKNQLLIAYTQIHYSIWKKLNQVQKDGFCIEQQATLQNIAKSLIQQTFSQDSFNYYLLLELITKIKDKPLNILQNLKQLLQEQNIKRRKQLKPKLSRHQRCNGLIEMRKALFVDIFYIDYFVSVHLYNKALSLTQRDISSQLKFNLKNYLLYNQSLLINGLLNEKTLQNISAMLNLEISKILYEQFFPNTKTVYIEDETQRIVTKEQQENDKIYTSQTIYFDNQGCENMNVLDFHLGKVYFSLHDRESALKCLRRVKQARQKKFDILSDEVIEVALEILKILVEQEDSGAAGEICQEYKDTFRDYYKKNYYFKSRYVARLQLIMAAIFECNGVIITSFRYYQRANRTFNQSKTNSYILQIHIKQQTMKLISLIKSKLTQMKTPLLGQRTKINKELHFSSGYLSEIVKPYFNNQFLRKTIEVKTTFHNPIVFNYLLSIYSLFRHEDYERAYKKLDKLVQTLKKRKVDQSYGITLEKLASYQIIQSNYQTAINNFQLAIDIHERFLQYPQKESHTLKCQIFILCCYSQLNQKKEFQDQLNIVDQFVAQFFETVQWNNIPYQSNSNKFKVLTLKLGKSFLFQFQDFYETIEKYQKVRYQLIQNLQNPQKLKQITQKYLEVKILEIKSLKQIKKLSITEKRQSCIFGQLSQQTIVLSRKSTFIRNDQQQKISQQEIENLETQKSTQMTTIRSHQPLKDNEITILVTSENQQQFQVQSDVNAIQKTLNSEDQVETERCAAYSNRFSSPKKQKLKCSTAIPCQIFLAITPINERVSSQSQQKAQKDLKKYKIDPFQKIKKK